jgi:hypothetical protein
MTLIVAVLAVAMTAAPLRAQCTPDAQGADDESGQKDLTQFCLGAACVGGTVASWSWDDTLWTGGNTGDSCAVFDTDNDGFANKAVCVTVGGAGVQQPGSPVCYTCNDSRPDRCAGAVAAPCTSTCSVVFVTDPFMAAPLHVNESCKNKDNCPAGADCCRTKDTQASCCLTTADAGGGVLIDVCSQPSGSPTSNPSDCIVNRSCMVDADCDDNNPCTVDTCEGTFSTCLHVAGNAGTTCRVSAGPCDVAETCTGSSINCPADGFANTGTCRNSSDLCDVAETCDGTGPSCPADGIKASGVVCRSSSGAQCDIAEVCDGVSKTCPADGTQPNDTPCDDNNACTSGDKCTSGSCAGTPIVCNDGNPCTTDSCDPASGCVHTPNNDPCNDNDACTTNDTCSGGSCVGGAAPNCNDANVCTTDNCNPASGCTHTNNSLPCSDDNVCTTNDTCAGGACVPGGPLDCNDGDACTDDACDAITGCTHTNNTNACNDGNACTSNDHCTNDVCAGTPIDCNDGNGCTDDGCDPATGCTHTSNNDPCDDGSACTTGDACAGGACVGGPPPNCNDGNVCTTDACDPASGCTHTNNSLSCSDGNECTTNDQCAGGVCVGGPAPDCDDGDACTADSCVAPDGCQHDPAVGNCCNTDANCTDTDLCTTNNRCVNNQCITDPVDCNDNNGCTDDGCDPATGCTHVNNNDPCDDGSACTTGDACAGGICVGGPGPDCNDNNVCTTDDCDAAAGCTHTNNALPCNDGDACTTNDACAGGACAGGPPPDCDDAVLCTTDGCDSASGCTHTNNAVPCDDGNACTAGDVCSGGTCAGTPIGCDDGNGCTDDGCNPASGCTHVDNTDPCDDGNVCTTNDLCSNGACAGSAINCSDGNVCTTDECDPATGCTHTNNDAPCTDGNPCTTTDVCSGGTCQGSGSLPCDDQNDCTDDSCSPPSGCVHTANATPCDDGNPCTEDDACSGGQCGAGTPKDCNDLEPCTDDTCNPETGMCEHANNADPCDDGDVCTVGDHCADGACQPGGPKSCNDNNDCTTDTCTPQTDCKHDPVPVPCCNVDADCVDTDPCTVNERCVDNQCLSDPRNCDTDNDPCTVDTCESAGGDFNCQHTPCYQLPDKPCPNQGCFPAVCGNMVVEQGETCDPPGSTTSNPGFVCRDNCTYCGDGTLDTGETCDDGNLAEGCTGRGFAVDTCQNNCTPPICKDPTTALLSKGIDRFTFHGRLVSSDLVDFPGRRFVVEVATPAGAVIYRASVPESYILARPGMPYGPFKYSNARAKRTAGIAKLKIKKRRDNFYVATVTAYGNLLGSRPDMVTHVHAGDTEWTVTGEWKKLAVNRWRFFPSSE